MEIDQYSNPLDNPICKICPSNVKIVLVQLKATNNIHRIKYHGLVGMLCISDEAGQINSSDYNKVPPVPFLARQIKKKKKFLETKCRINHFFF